MIDDELVLRVERLRDALEEFKKRLRKAYRKKDSRVGANTVQTKAAQLAERWLVEVADRADVREAITDEVLADLNIEFQRILTYSERSTPRQRYDAAIATILKDFRVAVVVALKQKRGTPAEAPIDNMEPEASISTAFVGQSFADEDTVVNEPIKRLIRAFGLTVITGEKPKADTVSAKVRDRIESAQLFVGIFTRRDKLARSSEWAASAWSSMKKPTLWLRTSALC